MNKIKINVWYDSKNTNIIQYFNTISFLNKEYFNFIDIQLLNLDIMKKLNVTQNSYINKKYPLMTKLNIIKLLIIQFFNKLKDTLYTFIFDYKISLSNFDVLKFIFYSENYLNFDKVLEEKTFSLMFKKLKKSFFFKSKSYNIKSIFDHLKPKEYYHPFYQ